LRLEQFGFVFQFHFLLPAFTALENVLIPIRRLGRLTGAEMAERALEILDSLDLVSQSEKSLIVCLRRASGEVIQQALVTTSSRKSGTGD
jgi:ABC-type lipoprotein export system ATPase subunit